MPCGHFCKTPCSTTHNCRCACEGSQRLEALAQEQANASATSWPVLDFQDQSSQQKSERQAAIDGYRAYAQGGSKKNDTLLQQMADANEQKRPVDLKLDTNVNTALGGDWPALSDNAQADGKQEKPSQQPEVNLIDF